MKVLTATEIWLFIVARVLAGSGAGVLSVRYFSDMRTPLAFTALIFGVFLF